MLASILACGSIVIPGQQCVGMPLSMRCSGNNAVTIDVAFSVPSERNCIRRMSLRTCMCDGCFAFDRTTLLRIDCIDDKTVEVYKIKNEQVGDVVDI